MFASSANLLRSRNEQEESEVSYVELFFDLVFVFAFTQLSHFLLEHSTLYGVLQTTLLLMALWWVWIYTSWVTNWLDPQRTPVRLMLFVLMLAGLVLSTSIMKAFDSRGLAFAAAYVFMQVGRCLFVLWALGRHKPPNYRNFQRMTAWMVLAGVLWIAGGLAVGTTRLALWAVAVLLEYLAPSIGFWTPGLGRSTTEDWDIDGGHMAERGGLFIIIALGESILITGATFAKLEWSPATIAAFVSALASSVAMWWIYFNIGAERASEHISTTSDPGWVARLAYVYLHLPLVAGIIVMSVADELILAHPTEPTDVKVMAAVLGGSALYLAGNLAFKRTSAHNAPLSHIVGLLLLAVLVPVAPITTPLILGVAATLVLVTVAVWETLSLQPTRRSGAREEV